MSFIERRFIYMMVMEEAAHRVKIGRSNNPVRRCKELYTSGVPHPYHILHVWEVEDMFAVEKMVHKALKVYRPNGGREFFEVFQAYEDSIDYSLPEVINGLVVHIELASDIDKLLKKQDIEFRRWYLNQLEDYDYEMKVHQKARRSNDKLN